MSLGELRDGNPLTSDSGEAADEPIDVTIPPSTGTAAPGPNQYGDVNDGQAFTPSDGELVASTVGRLYIEFPGGRTMVCSGTVVNSEYGNMVVTAAHCLYSAIDGEMSSRVQFVPADADNGNTAPYGLWEGDEWIVPQVFVDTAKEADNRSTGRGWAYDFGWVRLLPDGSGANVQDYTGGQGISFNQQYQGGLLVGYPSGPPFDGNSAALLLAAAPRIRHDVLAAPDDQLQHDPWHLRRRLADRRRPARRAPATWAPSTRPCCLTAAAERCSARSPTTS